MTLLGEMLGEKLQNKCFKKKGLQSKTVNPLFHWSERWDSNSRPLAPHASALPGCATPRIPTLYRDLCCKAKHYAL